MTERLTIALHDVGVRRDKRWVLKHVSANFRPGERWALIGENGAGKTQLMKLLSMEVWPTPTGHEMRRYRIGRKSIEEMDAKPLIAYVGAELQDKYARYAWDFTVRVIVATGLHDTDILLSPVTREQRRIVSTLLRECGLLSLAGRRFLSLSYGQKRLTLLARALIRRPDWLLLDEFYNGLDSKFRSKADAILARARKRGQSWVVCAHRALDIPAGTTHVMHLQEGRVLSSRRLRAADTAKLQDPTPELPARASKGPQAASGAPLLIRLDRVNLYVEYRPVLKNLDWQLFHGHQWAVVGANGTGKSSFLKLLYGDLAPALGGSIERVGYPRGTHIETWKRSVGFISPELQSDYAIDVSVEDIVVSGRHASIGLNEAPDPEDLRVARYWMEYFKLSSVAQRRPRELSYGQMRRALFARALAGAPRMLLLDEPMTGLDMQQRALMRDRLSGLMARGLTLVMAVHHLEDLPAGMTHGLRLHNRQAREVPLRIAN